MTRNPQNDGIDMTEVQFAHAVSDDRLIVVVSL